jgi:hypothetical protein
MRYGRGNKEFSSSAARSQPLWSQTFQTAKSLAPSWLAPSEEWILSRGKAIQDFRFCQDKYWLLSASCWRLVLGVRLGRFPRDCCVAPRTRQSGSPMGRSTSSRRLETGRVMPRRDRTGPWRSLSFLRGRTRGVANSAKCGLICGPDRPVFLTDWRVKIKCV